MVVRDTPHQFAAVRIDHDIVTLFGRSGMGDRRFNAQDGNRVHSPLRELTSEHCPKVIHIAIVVLSKQFLMLKRVDYGGTLRNWLSGFRIGTLRLTGALLAFAASPSVAFAQFDVFQGDGYEAFPRVEYQGGDASFKHKRFSVFVLTDSTLGYYACARADCLVMKGQVVDFTKPHWVKPLRELTAVSASTMNRGPSVTGRVLFGALATDSNDELFGFTYETEKTAEAPVFKMPKHMAGQLEAKVRFRLKKLGVVLPE